MQTEKPSPWPQKTETERVDSFISDITKSPKKRAKVHHDDDDIDARE